jgi:hypothetical protein
MAAAPTTDTVEVGPRTPRTAHLVDLRVLLAVTAVASTSYLLAVTVRVPPPPGLSVAFFTLATVSAAVALVILWWRGRVEADPPLQWFAAGLAVSVPAMLLQLVSFPLVAGNGGPFGTTGEGSAGLYLVFHAAPAVAALTAVARVPLRWRRPAIVAGLVVVAATTVNLVPLPQLMEGTRYTATLVLVEAIVSVVVLAAAVLWARQSGRASSPLHAWIVVHLSLVFYDLVFNAVGAERFTPVWWASLSMRSASFAVLAGGALVTVLRSLRLSESYTESELARRERQLSEALAATRRLLSISEGLSLALTEQAVHAQGVSQALSTLGGDGWAATWCEPDAVTSGPLTPRNVDLLLCGSRAETSDAFSADASTRLGEVEALASLPIRDSGRVSDHLLVWSPQPHTWSARERDVLAGLADQLGIAVARAKAYEQQAAAARTLQASLLPARLPALPQLALFASYVPGDQGAAVGGDWYDCISIDSHRAALVIGDVMGKGMRAAAVMGQVRTAVRAVSLHDPAPAAVLRALDGPLIDLAPDEIITMLYLLVDLDTGLTRIGRAGHLPLLVAHAEGRPELVYDGGSPPIGLPGAERTESTVQLSPGTVLVMFTDGLVEDRHESLSVGLNRLLGDVTRVRDTAAGRGGDPAAAAHGGTERTLLHTGGMSRTWQAWTSEATAMTAHQDDAALVVGIYGG